MRAALGLYGLLLLLMTRPVLHRRHWVDRAPRLAILAWQVTDVGVDLVHLVHACGTAVTSHDVGAAEVALLLVAFAVLLALCRIGWRQARATRRARRQQRVLIDLVTTP